MSGITITLESNVDTLGATHYFLNKHLDDIDFHLHKSDKIEYYPRVRKSFIEKLAFAFQSLCYSAQNQLPKLQTFATNYSNEYQKDGVINVPEDQCSVEGLTQLFTQEAIKRILNENALWCDWFQFAAYDNSSVLLVFIVNQDFTQAYSVPIKYKTSHEGLVIGSTLYLDKVGCILHQPINTN
jgi:hypothetical protein